MNAAAARPARPPWPLQHAAGPRPVPWARCAWHHAAPAHPGGARHGLPEAERRLGALVLRDATHIEPMEQGVALLHAAAAKGDRSEERRVGKECRSRWSPYH